MQIKFFRYVLGICLALSIQYVNSEETKTPQKNVFVIVHGATGGGWAWKNVAKRLEEHHHVVYRPTLTGLGERMHLASPEVNLTTHIYDVVNLIKFEQLDNIILVGHSYGGMVITGVMDLMPGRIQSAIFLDAAVPEDGMSAEDIWGSLQEKGWVKSGMVNFPWLQEADHYPKDVVQSYATFTEPVSFKDPKALKIPATYVAFISNDKNKHDAIQEKMRDRALSRRWKVRTLKSDHNAQTSHPKELAALIEAAVVEMQ